MSEQAGDSAGATAADPLIGIGYRHELRYWIDSNPEGVDCLEITAEHFFNPKLGQRLEKLSQKFPIAVHGLGLSIGTPGPLDRGHLQKLAHVANSVNALWISEHIGFSRTNEVDLGHFNPVAPTPESVNILTDHVHSLRDACNRPVILENISSALRVTGNLSETTFINRLCEQADCGLLLDVTNLFINSRNHGFDPYDWLRDIDPRHITQLHVVGYSYARERWFDWHREPIQRDLWELISTVLKYAHVKLVILERDANFPPVTELERELHALKQAACRTY